MKNHQRRNFQRRFGLDDFGLETSTCHAVNLICPNCRSWNFGAPSAADKFCSWCGRPLFEMDVRPAPEEVYMLSENGALPAGKRNLQSRELPNFKLILHNHGLVPVEVVDITASPAPCVYFPQLKKPAGKEAGSERKQRRSLTGGIQLAPGEMREVEGRFHFAALRQALRAENGGWRPNLKLQLQPRLATAWRAPSCELTVMPPPEFEWITPALHLSPSSKADAATVPCLPLAGLRLRHNAVQISGVESALPGIGFTPAAENALPATLHAGEQNDTILLQVEVAREMLDSHREKDRPLLAHLKIVGARPAGVFQPPPLKIIPRLFADLAFPDFLPRSPEGIYELKTWALAGRSRDLTVRVKNTGEQALEIHAVEATRELDFLMRKSPALPARVAPQEIAVFHFMLDLRQAPIVETYKGRVAFRFRTDEKDRERSAQFDLQVEARMPSRFHGHAALDFGAGHSCLAVIEQPHTKNAAARLLEIQGETMVPTAVRYHRVEGDGERIYDIGRAATAANSRPVLEDFKRVLHQEQSLPVLPGPDAQAFMLTPRAIAADYLRALLQAAEDRLAEELFARGQQQGEETDFSACLLQEMLVACPTTFTYQQKHALRQALSECSVNIKADSFQPAAAVACFHELQEMAALWQSSPANASAALNTRHVLGYDLGAAFTDMALVRFDFAPARGEADVISNIRAKIIGVDGDDQFGGRHLTAAVAKYLAQQAMAQLAGKTKARPLLPLWHHAGAAPVKDIERVGLLNWKHLLHHAELVKRQLAAEPATAEQAVHNLTLRIVAGKKLQSATFERLSVKASFLEKVAAERLALHLRKMQKLLRAAKLEAPDLIYLSGRGVMLPVVRKTIAAAFNCRIVFAGELAAGQISSPAISRALENLKTSVALGGVQYFQRNSL